MRLAYGERLCTKEDTTGSFHAQTLVMENTNKSGVGCDVPPMGFLSRNQAGTCKINKTFC